MDGGGEGGGRGFGVIEGDDEEGVGFGEGAVPGVVEVWGADDEAAAVDGEEEGEFGGGGGGVIRGEEDAVGVSQFYFSS